MSSFISNFKMMKEFLVKVLLFTFLSLGIYFVISLYILPEQIAKEQGPSTGQQIDKSFQKVKEIPFDLVILGNSGTYRGINPTVLEIPAFNFSHDNDSYNQIYYKIIWMEEHDIDFNYLVLGVDYFQFNVLSATRNYIYNSYLNDDYKKDYPESNAYTLFLDRTMILDVNRMKYLQNLFSSSSSPRFQRDNGQYLNPHQATKDDKAKYSIKRLPFQEKYFKLILEYCKKHEIEVFLTMMPARKNALVNYERKDIIEFNTFIKSFSNSDVHFVNYSEQKGWTLDDYTDVTHLNEAAANRFTKQLNDTISDILKH